MGRAADSVIDRPVGGDVAVSIGGADARMDAALIDALAAQRKVLAREQAREAALMVEFADVRRRWDQRRIGDIEAEGRDARYAAGEFAAIEIAMAVKASRHSVQQVMAVARRLRAETPDAYDAWQAGEIDLPRAVRINRALLRLTRDDSKQLLNACVVDVAVCRTAELLGRWLNEFIATVEPDQTDERLRRSLDDRYVSVRPDLDGVSFLSAAMSSVDASAVDQVLTALAAAAAADDPRTMQQRRADALVDVLLGRISNGCHVTWVDDADEGQSADGIGDCPADDQGHCAGPAGDTGSGHGAADNAANDPGTGIASPDLADRQDDAGRAETSDDDAVDDWEQPASVFRPDFDQTDHPPTAMDSIEWASLEDPETDRADPASPPRGRVVVTPCPGNHQPNPVPAVIGVIVSAQSLFGLSNTPGQLVDRSALVSAETIRALAQQPGTLFHRLLTDERGNLLDVTELGRFPSRKLGLAINYRDGVCVRPGCHTAATRCDHDHFVPVPDGPTTGRNLGPGCRPDHRAKTHAAHEITRVNEHTIRWTTPSGHTYLNQSPPLPVENWCGDSAAPTRAKGVSPEPGEPPGT